MAQGPANKPRILPEHARFMEMEHDLLTENHGRPRPKPAANKGKNSHARDVRLPRLALFSGSSGPSQEESLFRACKKRAARGPIPDATTDRIFTGLKNG
jgi:hypothetical protein